MAAVTRTTTQSKNKQLFVEMSSDGELTHTMPYASIDLLLSDAVCLSGAHADVPIEVYELVSMGKYKTKITAEKV